MTAIGGEWDRIRRVPTGSGQEVVTISGRSFCVSARSGNIESGGAHGFFHEDTRFLSRLHLSVNGADPEVVDGVPVGGDEAVFFMRCHTLEQPEEADAGLVVRRHRYQGPTLHEDISVDNLTGEIASVTIDLDVDADFADLFDVRFAGPVTRNVPAHPHKGGLAFDYSSGGFERGTEVRSSEPAGVIEKRITFNLELGPHERWKSCVDVVPVIDGAPLEAVKMCEEQHEEHKNSLRPGHLIDPPRVRSSADALEHLWTHSLGDLAALEIRMDGGRAFAAGIPWYVALFGRDSIIASIETMLLGPEAGLGTANLLASLQGTETRETVSEEPGKMLHEVRFGERSFPFEELSRYYGTVDTTPLWCMLLDKLYRWGGDPVRLRELVPNLRAAVGWITRRLESGDGLLTYTGDPVRLANQGWKDSFQSIVDERGDPLEPPIAVVEAQGYAVAALRSAALLEQELGEQSRTGSLLQEADELQRRIEERFWRPDLGTFDMAIGRDGRPANSVSSNPGHLLWAGAVSQERAEAVAASLLGEQLWSGWGIRTLASDHPGYNPVSYHRGSVWPHDTMLAVAGLFSYGLSSQALTLAGGILEAAAHFSYELPEVFSGIAKDEVQVPVANPTTSSPQAWSAAVPIYLIEQLLGIRPDLPMQRLVVSPRLPEGVELELAGLRLGEGVLSLRVDGRHTQLLEVPGHLDVVVE